MSSFIKNIQNTAHTHKLWSRDSKILVAVSGGPDSICLLHALVYLSKKYNWTLRIVHVNYGLRAIDSDLDEKLVRSLAKKYTVPISVLKPRITETSNLEERLREIRYTFFEQTRKKYAFESIATAHTLDDQAETVLMRLIRGSGLAGLFAMQFKTNHIIRPLLNISRENVMQYITEHSLVYRNDTSNTDIRFTRNAVRHKLIPYLQRNFNPSIKEVLAHTATLIAHDYELLIKQEFLSAIPYTQDENGIHFSILEFLHQNQSMQRISLRRMILQLRGNIKGITGAHIQEILKTIQSTKNKNKILSFYEITFAIKGQIATLSCIIHKK